MNTDFWTTILEFTQATTRRVGTRLLEFGQLQATQKADGSLVTQADKWADQELRTAIASTFPDHGILSEEGNQTFPGTDWCWVIDPVDGTTNFTRGIPLWAISVGLLYQGTPVFGCIYLPPVNQFFHGFYPGEAHLEISPGAFCNNRPIHTSDDDPSSNHFFSVCARSTSVIQRGFPCKFRMLGVASYNFLTVAAGITLGAVEATPKVWDLAAVWVIVKAAGGEWVALDSQPLFPLLAQKDYGERSFPTLVVSRAELVPVFQPFLQSIGQS